MKTFIYDFLWRHTIVPAYKATVDHFHLFLLASMAFLGAQYFVPKKDQSWEIRQLIPMLSSTNSLEQNLAYAYGKSIGLDETFPTQFANIEEYIKKRAAHAYQTGSVTSNGTITGRKNSNMDGYIDSKLKNIIRETIKKEKEIDLKTLKKEIEKLQKTDKKDPVTLGLKRGDKLITQGRCYSAYVSFWKVAENNWDNQAAWDGMRVASSCIEPKYEDAYANLSMQVHMAANRMRSRYLIDRTREQEKYIRQKLDKKKPPSNRIYLYQKSK